VWDIWISEFRTLLSLNYQAVQQLMPAKRLLMKIAHIFMLVSKLSSMQKCSKERCGDNG